LDGIAAANAPIVIHPPLPTWSFHRLKMKFVILNLDVERPLDEKLLNDVCRYLKIFFGAELDVQEVPETPTSNRGWESLIDRLNMPLKARPGRPPVPPSNKTVGRRVATEWQLYVPDLIACLERLRIDGKASHGIAVDGAEIVLALTGNELFTDEGGLLPGEPVPEDRTQRCFARSGNHPVGVCSIAQLLHDKSAGTVTAARLVFRTLVKLAKNNCLDLLGLKKCHSKECLAYLRQFDEQQTSFNLCAHCEESLLKRTEQCSDYQATMRSAATRYQQMHAFLLEKSADFGPIKIGMRTYDEFEEECDWLSNAEEIFLEVATERFSHNGPSGAKDRRRSLKNCLLQAHQAQPHVSVNQRSYSTPLLARSCLVDMMKTAPHRHGHGQLGNWSTAIQNKLHKSGGLYVEMGGSLKGKTIGTFADAGLNASLSRRDGVLAKTFSSVSQMPRATPQARRVHSVAAVDIDLGKTQRSSSGLLQTTERPMMRRRNANSLNYTSKAKASTLPPLWAVDKAVEMDDFHESIVNLDSTQPASVSGEGT